MTVLLAIDILECTFNLVSLIFPVTSQLMWGNHWASLDM